MKHKGNRIAVIGLGPVGQMLAVYLKESGQEVMVFDKDKMKIHLINKEGIKLEGVVNKSAKIDKAFTSFDELGKFKPQVIFIAVKAYHLPQVLKEINDLNLKDTTYISAQNGIDVELQIAEQMGEENTMRMVINFAGNYGAPNKVKVTFFNPPNYLASIDDSRENQAAEIAGWLNSVGLDTIHIDSFSLLKRIWEKTILNASLSALCGIGQLTMKEAMDMPDTVEVIEKVINEAVEVAKAENIFFEDNFIRKCMRYLRKAGNHFPSLAVDLLNERPTEIDYFNGKIVQYGRKHYIPTPMNLTFTNLVRGLTNKYMKSKTSQHAGTDDTKTAKKPGETSESQSGNFFLGIDMGSAYTKISVINEAKELIYHHVIRSLNRDKNPLYDALHKIHNQFEIKMTCATGYGRETFPDADITKTEIQCAAKAVFHDVGKATNIIDIGAEDIKTLQLNEKGQLSNFYMNTKCAAGTGAFISEVAEKAEIDYRDMSKLAAISHSDKELNSFCTVFAKTEVMKWIFDQMPVEDIAKGIYLSIANRIIKLRTDPTLPVYLVGGVVAYHPYMRDIMESKTSQKVYIASHPQFMVSMGAALYAMKSWQLKQSKKDNPDNKNKKPAEKLSA